MANRRKENIQVDAPFDAKPALPDGLPAVSRLDGTDATRVAGAFGQLAEESGKWADRAAKIEGKQAGEAAGNDPNWRPSGSTTIYGAAADEAGVSTYLNNLDAKVRSGMSDLYQTHQNDPGALKSALDQLKAGLTKDDVFPEIAGSFNASFERLRLPLQVKALENWQGIQRDQARASAMAADSAGATLRRQIILADPGGEGTRRSVEDLLATDAVRRRNLVRAEQMTAQEAEKKNQEDRQDTEVSLIEAQAGKLATPEAVRAFQDEFKAKFAAGTLPGKMNADGYDRAMAALDRRVKDLVYRGRTELGDVKKGLDLAISLHEEGMPLSAGEITQLRDRASGLPGGDVLVRDFDAKRRIVDDVRTTPVPLIRRQADAIEAEAARSGQGLTTEQGAKVRYLRERADKKDAALRTDQVEWFRRSRPGVFFSPDFSVPTEGTAAFMATQMAARIPKVAEAARQEGVRPLFLSASDKATLKAVGEQGGPRMVEMMEGIVRGAGADAPAVLAEIGGTMPELAKVGVLAASARTGTAMEVAQGLALRKQAQIQGGNAAGDLPLPKDTTEIARAHFGSALVFSPEESLATLESAKAIYQKRAAERGGVDPTSREAKHLFQDSLDAASGAVRIGEHVYGGTAAYKPPNWFFGGGKVKVTLPANVRQDKAPALFGALRDEDLRALPGGPPRDAAGVPYTAADFRGAVPVKVKGGYAFAHGVPGEPGTKLMGPPDKPFVLDLDAMAPVLRQRVPDAYLGAGVPEPKPGPAPAAKPPASGAEPLREPAKPEPPKPWTTTGKDPGRLGDVFP